MMSGEGGGHVTLAETYRNSATIHGVSKLQSRDSLYMLRPVIWLILMLGMLGGLSFLLYSEISRYFTYPTATKTTMQFQPALAFPAITICNLNYVKESVVSCSEINNGNLLDTLFYDLSDLGEFLKYGVFAPNKPVVPINYGNSTGYQLRECVMGHVHTAESFMPYCVWNGRARNCSDIFRPVVTGLGQCFTLDSQASSVVAKSTETAKGLRVILNTRYDESYYGNSMHTGVKVLINDHGEMPLPLEDGLFLGMGVAANIEMKKEKRIGLSKPFKAFGGKKYCEDTSDPSFEHNVREPYKYTRDACERECYLQELADICGCRHFFDNHTDGVPPCSLRQMCQCYINTSRALDETGAWQRNCNCPLPCSRTHYPVSVSYATFGSKKANSYLLMKYGIQDEEHFRKNYIDVSIYYSDLVTYTIEEVPEVQLGAILGSIGGNMGLFLGASLLSVSELVELVVLLVVSCVRRRKQPSAAATSDTNIKAGTSTGQERWAHPFTRKPSL